MTICLLGSARRALGFLLPASLVCATALGCSAASDEENVADVGQIASPIINGTNSTADQDEVVLLAMQVSGGIGNCTGTFVAPNLILTARHCVSDTDEGAVCTADGKALQGGAIYSDHKASSIYVFTGVNAIKTMQSGNAAAVGKKIIVDDDAKVLCNNDLAFLVLDRSVAGAKIAPLRLKNGAREGEELTAVGWGLTESGKMPSRRMQRTGVKVIAPGPIEDSSSKVGVGDSEFIVGESICSGDSGGPALSAKGAVVGVVSRGGNSTGNPNNPGSSCTGDAINFYTQLVTQGALVQRAFDAAGATPLDEGTMDGAENGAACKDDGDCSGGACAQSKCANGCKTNDDCASNEECKLRFGKHVCVATGPAPAPTDDAGASTDDPGATDSPTGSQDTPAGSTTTTTTTTTGCSSAPSSSGASTLAGWALGLGLVLAARRRRS